MARETTLPATPPRWPPSSSLTGMPAQTAREVALAHALRTPLTVIRAQAQLLRWWAERPGALNFSSILAAAARIEEATGELTAAIDAIDLCAALYASPVEVALADGEQA
jgi:signal transduction histidine kinase